MLDKNGRKGRLNLSLVESKRVICMIYKYHYIFGNCGNAFIEFARFSYDGEHITRTFGLDEMAIILYIYQTQYATIHQSD
jgi:hypothetical protein